MALTILLPCVPLPDASFPGSGVDACAHVRRAHGHRLRREHAWRGASRPVSVVPSRQLVESRYFVGAGRSRICRLHFVHWAYARGCTPISAATRRRVVWRYTGIPYAVVDSAVSLKTVEFQDPDESDGVNHSTRSSFPFYPIPDEAITAGTLGGRRGAGQRLPAQHQRSSSADRRPRPAAFVRALQRVLRRRAMARRVGRVLRS